VFADKIAQLRGMFPDMDELVVRLTLKDAGTHCLSIHHISAGLEVPRADMTFFFVVAVVIVVIVCT
jgi:hypothetical protein